MWFGPAHGAQNQTTTSTNFSAYVVEALFNGQQAPAAQFSIRRTSPLPAGATSSKASLHRWGRARSSSPKHIGTGCCVTVNIVGSLDQFASWRLELVYQGSVRVLAGRKPEPRMTAPRACVAKATVCEAVFLHRGTPQRKLEPRPLRTVARFRDGAKKAKNVPRQSFGPRAGPALPPAGNRNGQPHDRIQGRRTALPPADRVDPAISRDGRRL